MYRVRHFLRLALVRRAAICVLLSGAIIAALANPTLSETHDPEEKPHLFVWKGGPNFSLHLTIDGAPFDKEGFFNEGVPEAIPEDKDAYFLFLTNGPEVVPNDDLRKRFRIKDESIESVVSLGHYVRTKHIMNRGWGLLPGSSVKWHVILVDLAQTERTYRRSCIRAILFDRVVGRVSKELLAACKRE